MFNNGDWKGEIWLSVMSYCMFYTYLLMVHEPRGGSLRRL